MAGNIGFFFQGMAKGLEMKAQYDNNRDQIDLAKRRLDLQEKQEERLQQQKFLDEKINAAKTTREAEKWQYEKKVYEKKLNDDNLGDKGKKLDLMFGEAYSDKYFDPKLKTATQRIVKESGGKIIPQAGFETTTDEFGTKTIKSVLYIPDTNTKYYADTIDELFAEPAQQPQQAEQGTDIMPLPGKTLMQKNVPQQEVKKEGILSKGKSFLKQQRAEMQLGRKLDAEEKYFLKLTPEQQKDYLKKKGNK